MIYLALGTNLGERAWNLEHAKALLAEELKTDMLCSGILETDAIGFSGPAFLNQVVGFESEMEPEALLDICQKVEREMGRPAHEAEYDTAGHRIYHDRIIDIDILTYNDLNLKTDRLVLPHPQVWERPYVKVLMNEMPDQVRHDEGVNKS